MAKVISEYSRTNSGQTTEEEENCIVATIQFRKLSKRQKWILHILMEHGTLTNEDIFYWCEYLEAKDVPSDGVFPATPKETLQRRIVSNIMNGARMHVDESVKQSIYRSLRELAKRDLVARLEHNKPAIWTWIDWRDGKGHLGFTHETGAFWSDHKLWGKDTWRSAHYRWGKKPDPTTKELKRNVKYYDRLASKSLHKMAHYKVEARNRGLLVDDRWIDE